MIIDFMTDFPFLPIFARIPGIIDGDAELLIKIEGFNPAGSIKLKPALALIKDLKLNGVLQAGSVLIDSTSGNMGIALAAAAKCMGYGFVCISDEKITQHNRKLICAYGADLVILEKSTLKDRYNYIRQRVDQDRMLVWTKQFENPVNPVAHEQITAREILDTVPRVDHLFIGVGTGGTLAGCEVVFRKRSPSTRIVAVDCEGSKHFSDAPAQTAPRRIPGIGSTQRSPFLGGIRVDKVVLVSEEETIRGCKQLLECSGWLLGGSSGSVISAVAKCKGDFRPGDVVVAICADFGERYLDILFRQKPDPSAGFSAEEESGEFSATAT